MGVVMMSTEAIDSDLSRAQREGEWGWVLHGWNLSSLEKALEGTQSRSSSGFFGYF
jgi:hypothetical protein